MNKDQFLGQLRAVLTAGGTALATWGLTDGNQWAPVSGVILAVVSLGWGLLWHRDPANPGKLKWSLVRKLANVTGAALVTYGFVAPGKVDSMVSFLAAFGPLLASLFSFIDNGENDNDESDGGFPYGIMVLVVAASFLLPGCGTTLGIDHEGNLEILIPYEALK